MIEDVTLRAFDEVVNPILLCELDGKVIYKNPEATRKLRKPIKGGKLQAYLSPDSRRLFVPQAEKECFPAFIEIESEGDLFAAFADVVYYERRPVIFLVISHLFLYEPSLPLFLASPATLREHLSAERLAHLVTKVYTSDLVVEASRNLAFHRRMTEVYYKLVDTFLTELAFGKERVHYPLAHTLELIRYTCDKVLSRLGLDILFTLDYEDADIAIVDFKSLTLLVSNLILLAAEIGDSHIITANIEQGEDDEVLITLQLSVKKPNAFVPLGGTASFAELLPGRSVDLFFFDQILKSGKYRFDFTLNQKDERNLHLRLRAPISHRLRIHQRDPFTLDEAYRLIDQLADYYLD